MSQRSESFAHRLTAVPGTTGAGFSSHIIITSKDSKATAKLRAYQAFNGAPLDVLDSEGNAVGATTSLTPANSAKTFQLEGARGWHTVIVEHPTKASMDAATVAMRLREPDAGVSVVLAERIEHCDPAPAPNCTRPCDTRPASPVVAANLRLARFRCEHRGCCRGAHDGTGIQRRPLA